MRVAFALLSACPTLLATPPLSGQDPKLAATFDYGGGHSAAISRDGKLLAGGEHDSRIRVWDVASRKTKFALDPAYHVSPAVAFSPDGKLLASASWDGTVRLWGVAAGRERSRLKGHT